MEKNKLQEFSYIFYPRAIAVLGVSSNGENAGTRFFTSLVKAGFKGKVFAVNPNGGRIDNAEIYRSVQAIPEDVDNAIIAVPAGYILEAMDDCAAKGVKAVQVYTAGFSETGHQQGCKLEEALVAKARNSGIRIVGPNCMGVYSPAKNLPYGMTNYSGEVGHITFLSQSGGLGGMVIDLGITRGLKFSKVVSFGNGSDLDSADYLEYFDADSQTKIIGAYLEGLKKGRRFLPLARRISKNKPFIVWRGGRTEAGARAAASHTGSLASPDLLWAAGLKQAGAVKVESIEEMVDTLLVFQQLGTWKGSRLAFVSGMTGGGGGISVSASDAFTSLGLKFPVFSQETQGQLKSLLPPVGSFVHNPLDIGGFVLPLDSLYRCLMTVIREPYIDLLVFHERTGNFSQPNYIPRVEGINGVLIKLRQDQPKPVVVISPSGTQEKDRLEIEKKLIQANIPVFPTMERAAMALWNLSEYWDRQEKD